MYSLVYNVFCITETWITSVAYDNEILHSNYILYRNDCESGGVLIAVHDSIPSSLFSSPSDLEIVCVEFPSFNSILCTVYVPPNSNESYFCSVTSPVSDLVTNNNCCIIVGDF